MTIREIVSTLRDSLKEQGVDTKYTNRFLWSLFLVSRNSLLKQEADSKKKIANMAGIWDTICVPMEPVSSLICNCDSLPYDCMVYRSKIKLPKFVESSYGFLYRYISTPDMSQTFSLVSPFHYSVKSKIKGNKSKYAFIDGGYLYTPDTTYPTLVVSGIFNEDVSKYKCTETTTTSNSSSCSTILDNSTGLPDYLEKAALMEALQLLLPSKSLVPDELPNRNSYQPTI